MARDADLERQVRAGLGAALGPRPGLAERPMFGTLAWMLDGHLLVCADRDGLLLRLGPGLEEWALETDGLEAARMGGRPMPGWVRADRRAADDPDLRARLLDGALAFVRTLPPGRTSAR